MKKTTLHLCVLSSPSLYSRCAPSVSSNRSLDRNLPRQISRYSTRYLEVGDFRLPPVFNCLARLESFLSVQAAPPPFRLRPALSFSPPQQVLRSRQLPVMVRSLFRGLLQVAFWAGR